MSHGDFIRHRVFTHAVDAGVSEDTAYEMASAAVGKYGRRDYEGSPLDLIDLYIDKAVTIHNLKLQILEVKNA